MAEFKGTSGPWVKDYGGTRGHIKSLGIPSGLTPTVARYDIRLVSRSDDEQEANGHIIAAAPDLLKSLCVMLPLVRLKYGNLDKDIYSEIEKAESAITKALGEGSVRQQPAFTVKPGMKLIHVQKRKVRLTATGWEYETNRSEVKVLAVAGIWAMVRCHRAVPFVTHIENLEELAAERIGVE